MNSYKMQKRNKIYSYSDFVKKCFVKNKKIKINKTIKRNSFMQLYSPRVSYNAIL